MDPQKPLTLDEPLEFDLIFEDWGLMDYSQALEKQLQYLEQVNQENLPGRVIFCTHPAVVTLGRASQPSDLTDWQGPLMEVSRGGRATYHGPSQLVVYPIVNLRHARKNRAAKEVVGFIRDFEKAIVMTLQKYGLEAQGKSLQKKSENAMEDATGVWIGSSKIASLGIAVKKWITYHGAAINLDEDPTAFRGLNPCGFSPSVMTNLERCCDRKIERGAFQNQLQESLQLFL